MPLLTTNYARKSTSLCNDLFENPKYTNLDAGAMLLYSFYDDRFAASLANQQKGDSSFVDNNGVFCIYSNEEAAARLHVSINTITRYKKQLVEHGLLIIKKTLSGSDKLYVLSVTPTPDEVELPFVKRSGDINVDIKPITKTVITQSQKLGSSDTILSEPNSDITYNTLETSSKGENGGSETTTAQEPTTAEQQQADKHEYESLLDSITFKVDWNDDILATFADSTRGDVDKMYALEGAIMYGKATAKAILKKQITDDDTLAELDDWFTVENNWFMPSLAKKIKQVAHYTYYVTKKKINDEVRYMGMSFATWFTQQYAVFKRLPNKVEALLQGDYSALEQFTAEDIPFVQRLYPTATKKLIPAIRTMLANKANGQIVNLLDNSKPAIPVFQWSRA